MQEAGPVLFVLLGEACETEGKTILVKQTEWTLLTFTSESIGEELSVMTEAQE